MLSSRIWSGPEVLEALSSDWDRILASCRRGIQGPDETCSATWARTLSHTLLRGSDLRTLVVSRAQEPVAILPTFANLAGRSLLRRRELRVITEAHGGRRSLLVADDDQDVVAYTLDSLRRELPSWDVLIFGAVEGSTSYEAFQRAARRLSLRTHCLAIRQAPYIELGSSWDEVLAALPKKMRWTIRKGEKDLVSMGRLEYQEVTSDSDVPQLLESIYAIERRSWKEEAGTSITAHERQQAFFERFAELAAKAGMLSGHVLRLDGKPLAYVLGALGRDGIFLDLKESFDISFAEQSPGHVLKRFAIETLIGRGVRTYDFMGRCEPYKMRWTDKTYRCLTVALYNRTPAGWLGYLRSRVSPRAAADRQ